jgi:inosine-uridine nucleoside N-ribohydrolase
MIDSPRAKPKIILDTDPGADDALAILVALEYADLRAITTVAGNVGVESGTTNALKVLALAGSAVPVYRGAAEPLHDNPVHAEQIHGEDGLGGANFPDPAAGPEQLDAVSFLLQVTRQEPDVALVAIGPLTNIALALRADPTFAARITGLTIMGGSSTHGNITSAAEFNIFADPEAADEVFRAVQDIRMIGLNLTHQVDMDTSHVNQFRAIGTHRADIIADMLAGYISAVSRYGTDRVFMHDPTAVVAVTHPELFEFEHRHVSVETKGTHTRGMTVVDQRTKPEASANAFVAVKVDREAVLAMVMASAL